MIKNVIIIAEAGVNHNGSVKLAKKLIDGASYAKADYIKFQYFKADALATKNTKKANYQLKRTDGKNSQYRMLKKLELSKDNHKKLKNYAHKKGIKFLTSIFDINGLSLIKELNLDYIKIPSGEITNIPYLRKIGKIKKPVIISTGMSNLQEISLALKVLTKSGMKKNMITILQCTTEYPSPISDININAMTSIAKRFNVQVGFSDHSIGPEAAIVAVAKGAKIIEKHITTDRTLSGPDHFASMQIKEFSSYVSMIRNAELALGDGVKRASKSEKKNISVSRKKICALKSIKKGEQFSENNLTTLRSNIGLPAEVWDRLIGKKSDRNYLSNDPILYKLKSKRKFFT